MMTMPIISSKFFPKMAHLPYWAINLLIRLSLYSIDLIWNEVSHEIRKRFY